MRGAPVRAGAPAAVPSLLLCSLLAAGLFAGGSFWVAGAALLLATGVLVLGLLGRILLAASGAPLPAALLALAAWSGVSIAWSVAPDRSWDELNRGIVYAAFAILGVAAGSRGPASLRRVGLVLATALGAAIFWALAGKAIPGLFTDGGRAARLRDPIGYWNALALAAGALLVLGLWLASRPPQRWLRPAGAVFAYAGIVATLLAVSRAGVLAALAGTAVWLLLERDRVERAALALAVAAPALAVGVWAFTRPALVEDGALRADRVADGVWFGLLALAGALVAALLAERVARLELSSAAHLRLGRALAAGAVAALVLAAGAVAVVGDPGSGESAQSPVRLGDASLNNRAGWWGEALELFADDPLRGTGAGSFEVAHRRVQDAYVPAVQPHDVPLQFLAGTGILGLLLFAAVVAAATAAAISALRRLHGDERSAAVALSAVLALYGVHALVDYSWDFVAVTGPILVAAGALAAAGRATPPSGRRVFAASAAAVLGLACLVSLATPWLAERSVRDVNRALDAGDFEGAAEAARRARSLDPLSIEPPLKLAGVEERRGRPVAARAAYAQAVRTQPENPETWYALGLYEFYSDDLCSAYVHLNEAYTLDPASRRWGDGGPLDLARAHVNAGRC
ncbi:MAG TPA: O-antigen ligase family protein [Gaiellaceae bacterium]|nr:O-antigen ligase family protein [Gaiellaceae bacterium]